MSDTRWLKVTREHPCPKCGHTDRCTLAPDGGAGRCWRIGETWHDRSPGANGNGAGYVGAAHRPKQRTATHSAGRDWRVEAQKLRGAMSYDRLSVLADATGLPAAALAMLSIGWASTDDLRAMRAGGEGWQENPPDGAWTFAEHDGGGRIVGISFRAIDGRKGSPVGAKRGLTVPTSLHALADPVLIVEGASDVAACCALGLASVGRPSNRAGAEHAAQTLDGRTVLVVGERDGKDGGAWPGRDGAKAVAQQLAGRWNEPVRCNAVNWRRWLIFVKRGPRAI